MTNFLKLLAAIPLLAFATSAALAQISFPVVHPNVVVGDRWKVLSLDGISKLQEGWLEEVVTAVGEDIEVSAKTQAGPQGPARYDRDWNAIVNLRGKIERQVKLDFPLELGKTWESKYEWINGRGHDGRMEMTFTVRGTERITVPAGTFDTVVIEGRGYWYNKTYGGSGVALEKRWYAPAAKRPVRRTWITRHADGRPDQNGLFEAAEVEVRP